MPPVDEINRDPQFRARLVDEAAFEIEWPPPNRRMTSDISRAMGIGPKGPRMNVRPLDPIIMQLAAHAAWHVWVVE